MLVDLMLIFQKVKFESFYQMIVWLRSMLGKNL